MGTAGSLGGEFRTAIRTESFGLAMNMARAMPNVPLDDALDLTILAATKEPAVYEALAVRWITRLLEEKSLTLDELRWTIERLTDAREGWHQEAGKALHDFLCKRPPRNRALRSRSKPLTPQYG